MKTSMRCGYSAPVCLTIAGGRSPFEPALMCAHPQRVKVSVVQNESPQIVPACLREIMQIHSDLYPLPDSPKYTWRVELPDGIVDTHMGVQSALISAFCACSLHISTGLPAIPSDVQKMAYQIEKKLFKLASHGQTTTSTVGGLVFYRKEFEFHKTVFKIPAHLPKDFNIEANLTGQPKRNIDTTIRRLVVAIIREDEQMFQSTHDASQSDIPTTWTLLEDREGLLPSAKTS